MTTSTTCREAAHFVKSQDSGTPQHNDSPLESEPPCRLFGLGYPKFSPSQFDLLFLLTFFFPTQMSFFFSQLDMSDIPDCRGNWKNDEKNIKKTVGVVFPFPQGEFRLIKYEQFYLDLKNQLMCLAK